MPVESECFMLRAEHKALSSSHVARRREAKNGNPQLDSFPPHSMPYWLI